MEEDDIPDYEPRKSKAPPKQKKPSAVMGPKPTTCTASGMTVHCGDRCYGSDNRGTWCQARVIDVNPKKKEVTLHYTENGNHDEWKPLTSQHVRLTPPQPADDGEELQHVDTLLGDSIGSKRPSCLDAQYDHRSKVPRPSSFPDEGLGSYSFLGDSPTMAPLPSRFDQSTYDMPEQLSQFRVADGGVDSAMIYESESPISNRGAHFAGFDSRLPLQPPLQTQTMLDLDNATARDWVKQLQLTRDFLRTVQRPPFELASAQYLVRLNMGSRYFMYVAAQVVQINGDELQVRGVDKADPEKVQHTKLAYVSNATFKDEEITAALERLHHAGSSAENVLNIPMDGVKQMVERKNLILKHPSYKTYKQAANGVGGGGALAPASSGTQSQIGPKAPCSQSMLSRPMMSQPMLSQPMLSQSMMSQSMMSQSSRLPFSTT